MCLLVYMDTRAESRANATLGGRFWYECTAVTMAAGFSQALSLKSFQRFYRFHRQVVMRSYIVFQFTHRGMKIVTRATLVMRAVGCQSLV